MSNPFNHKQIISRMRSTVARKTVKTRQEYMEEKVTKQAALSKKKPRKKQTFTQSRARKPRWTQPNAKIIQRSTKLRPTKNVTESENRMSVQDKIQTVQDVFFGPSNPKVVERTLHTTEDVWKMMDEMREA